MCKRDWAVVRDFGRLVVTATAAHGLTTRTWREWHSFGLAFWLVGELAYALA
jgi:hypothetical protein